MTDLKIITEYVPPPIPVRIYDWRAYYDGHEEGPIGWGRSERDAVNDLDNYEVPS